MVELREARKIAANIGLGLQYVLKEARIFDIWSRLSPILISRRVKSTALIVCKGGTALNKIYLGGVQRFSEDLDFDAFFRRNLTRRQKIDFLQENLIAALTREYEVQTPRMMREVARFTSSFNNEMGKRDSIIVEFNLEAPKVGRVLLKEARSELWNLAVRVPSYSFEALVAKKLKTFYQRESGKDLYDIYRSLQGRSSDEIRRIVSMLRRVLKSEGIKYSDFVSGFIKTLNDQDLMATVHASSNPYVPRSLRIDWKDAAEETHQRLASFL